MLNDHMYTFFMKAARLSLHRAQPRVSLHTAVASRIGSLIAQGEIPPGSILPNETSLGEQFGVSRTALREGIKVLASKGLIEVRRKTGTRVNAHLQWNMLDPELLTWMFSGEGIPPRLADLMEVRMLVEPASARMAAQRATQQDFREIREGLEAMENSTGDLASSVEADLRFHMAVLEATHNAFMRPFGALIQAALRGSFRLTSSNAGLYRLTLPLHHQVFSAIEARNSQEAEAAMKTLLNKTLHDIDEQTKLFQRGQKKPASSKRAAQVDR